MSKLTNGLLVTMLSAASVAVAADSEYPATDFQPKIVFQDSEYKHIGSASSESNSGAEVSVPDSNYPAANFQPEVLFEDSDYKHSKGNESVQASKSKPVKKSEVDGQEVSESEEGDVSSSDDGSLISLLVGLGILVAAGFAFYKKNTSKEIGKKKSPASKNKKTVRRKTSNAKSTEAVVNKDTSTSGVSKYLESKVDEKPSRVEQYLEEKTTSVSTVSKYVAKQKISARVASVTGVDKYLKDNG